MKVRLVLAGNYQQFKIYCRENGWKDAVYVEGAKTLTRYHPGDIELYMAGTYLENKAYDQRFWVIATEVDINRQALALWDKYYGKDKSHAGKEDE